MTFCRSFSYPFKYSLCLLLLFCLRRGFGGGLHAQSGANSRDREFIIRSGVTGVIGVSHLYLDNAVRPYYSSSAYYQFHNDLFVKVGAMITAQPVFMGDHFQLVFDPAFSKYSWGNYEPQRTDSISTAIDIDLEAFEFPISVRYSFLPYTKKFQPFIRAGYSLAGIIHKDAEFRSMIYSKVDFIEFVSHDFPFANMQQAVFLSAGLEINLRYVDYTLELVCQKGEGIDAISNGKSFMSISNTTNCYVQVGVLF